MYWKMENIVARELMSTVHTDEKKPHTNRMSCRSYTTFLCYARLGGYITGFCGILNRIQVGMTFWFIKIYFLSREI